eukprot:Pgem_evm1s6418
MCSCNPNSTTDFQTFSDYHWTLRCCLCGVVHAFLYCIQITIAYFLMLIAMTYNTWLFLALIGGSAVGYMIVRMIRCRSKMLKYATLGSVDGASIEK